MYYLYINHDWAPSVYFDAPESDKRLIRAFIQKESKDYEDLRKEAENGG